MAYEVSAVLAITVFLGGVFYISINYKIVFIQSKMICIWMPLNINNLRHCGWINPTSDIGFLAAKPSSRPHMKIKASNLKSYVRQPL